MQNAEHPSGAAPAGDLPEGKNAKLYSLAEVAKICEVSRQAVYKRLNSDNRLTTEVDRLTRSDGRRRLFTADAVEVLKQAFSKSGTAPASVNQTTTKVDGLTEQVDTELTTKVDTLTTEVDKLTKERDHLRDQLDDVTADREALIKQLNQMRGELMGRESETKRLAVQFEQLREDHREELAAVRRGHAAELDRIQEAHRQQLDDLRAQLEEVKHDLTEERQHSRDTAERLAQLADQAQRLQLAQMQPPAQIPERKPTLWARLFGKHKHDFDIEGGQDHSPD